MLKTLKAAGPMLVTCVLAGTVLAVLAPLDTHIFKPVWRFIFWISLCIVGGLGAGITDVLARVLKWDLKNWQWALWQSLTSTMAVMSVLLIAWHYKFGPLTGHQLASLFFYIWVISASISLVGALMRKSGNTEDALQALGLATTHPAIHDRLAQHLRSAEIYALAAEDHYVRVITDRGEDLVLLRLTDAIKETTPLIGLSPHRSWWVAEAGVTRVKKSKIILRSGQTVPISRTGMKQVREAGWR